MTVPVANFTANVTSAIAGDSIQFNDSSSGSPTAWSWNFGDSQTSTAQNPSHVYTAAGNHTVSLTIANAVGSNATTLVVSILAPASNNTASGNVSTKTNEVETIDDSHLYQNFTYTPTLYYTNATFSTQFESINLGDYDVISSSVKVDDAAKTSWIDGNYVYFDASNLKRYPHNVNVIVMYTPVNPASTFSYSFSGYAPVSVSFVDHSSYYPTSWEWDFGDVTSSTGETREYQPNIITVINQN